MASADVDSLQFDSLRLEEEPLYLSEAKSVNFIRDSKTMFLLRGVPGSGKSTISKRIQQLYDTDCVCSADDYFMKNGTYNYDNSKIQDAHKWCQQKAKKYCQEGHNVVIIDNTNIKKWETRFYTSLAHQYGYVVIMITPQAQWNTAAAVLAARNKHGVPADVIQSKVQGFEQIIPYFLAWFMNDRAAAKLEEITKKYFLKNTNGVLYSPTVTQIRHVTSVFLGKKANDERDKRSLFHELQSHIGRVDVMHIIAIVLTPRTVSAMVKLDQSALNIYHNDPEQNGLKPGVAAHITLGCAVGVPASEARADTIATRTALAGREKKPDLGEVVQLGDISVCILDKPWRFEGIFAGGYGS